LSGGQPWGPYSEEYYYAESHAALPLRLRAAGTARPKTTRGVIWD
jgi:hypothetical protein